MTWNIRVRADGVECGRVLRWGYLFGAALFAFVAIATFAFSGEQLDAVGWLVVGWAFAIAYLATRSAFGGVRLSPAGVLVRNPLRTHRVAWRDFVEFDVGKLAAHPKMGVVVRRVGKPVHIFTLAAWGPFEIDWDDEAVDDAVADLNVLASRFPH